MANEMMTADEMTASLRDFILKAENFICQSVLKNDYVITLKDGSMIIKKDDDKYRLDFITPDLSNALNCDIVEARKIANRWNANVSKPSLCVKVAHWKTALMTQMANYENLIEQIEK